MRIIKRITVCLLVVVFSFGFEMDSASLSIDARSYVVLNADTLEVLDSSNAHLRLPIASTTKILTALILAEQNTPEKEVVTTAEMVTVEGSSMGLLAGDSVSYYELLVGMLLSSGNDAANTAAISVAGSVEKFAELMNKRAAEIGMVNSHFVTPSGLDDEEHYSTAYDMALLTSVALDNPLIREIVSQKKITVTFGNPPYQRTLYNHNKLLDKTDICIGVKTGYTKKSGRCLVSAAQSNGCTVIVVTLNDGDDWNDHEELLKFGLSELESCDVTADLPVASIDVVGGYKEEIPISTEQFVCGVTDGNTNRFSFEYDCAPFVYAPIVSGTKVGEVRYYYDGLLVNSEDIVAVDGAERAVVSVSNVDRFYFNILKIFSFFT